MNVHDNSEGLKTGNTINVSTPSRLCLFGEHLDYLGLEVIACAINLRFRAAISVRTDRVIHIKIRDSRVDTLGMANTLDLYEDHEIDLDQPIVYINDRDYLKSSIAVLLRSGLLLKGFDIVMDSEIPIGKGMCSSSTMIVVLIKALLEGIQHADRNNPEKIAYWAYLAEVEEFGEPGGMMDHYSSALGGMLHLDFEGGKTKPHKMATVLPGCLILFDSKEQKNTTAVLAGAKEPALRAIRAIGKDVRTIILENIDIDAFDLDNQANRVLKAACENYRILQRAKKILSNDIVDSALIGKLIYQHHCQLRDGLGISTPKIEQILDTAISHGAWGGKINGSGGGGCCFVYADLSHAPAILEAVQNIGFPGQILLPDTGVRVDL